MPSKALVSFNLLAAIGLLLLAMAGNRANALPNQICDGIASGCEPPNPIRRDVSPVPTRTCPTSPANKRSCTRSTSAGRKWLKTAPKIRRSPARIL